MRAFYFEILAIFMPVVMRPFVLITLILKYCCTADFFIFNSTPRFFLFIANQGNYLPFYALFLYVFRRNSVRLLMTV